LEIGDDGVGLPEGLDFRKADTLGLKLVVALVRQIKGTIEVPGERGEGTEFMIAFKGGEC
jgi:two-component sensor histidine kinase